MRYKERPRLSAGHKRAIRYMRLVPGKHPPSWWLSVYSIPPSVIAKLNRYGFIEHGANKTVGASAMAHKAKINTEW